MFRMNGKNRKKASKEKKVDSKQKYQENFNEIILNDLVPEEKREEFGLNSTERPKENKSNGLKLNFALGSKKSNSKTSSKGKHSNASKETNTSKDNVQKNTKHNKKNNASNDDTQVEENTKTTKGKNSTNSKKNNSAPKGKKTNNSKHSESRPKNSKKKSKSSNAKTSEIDEIQEQEPIINDVLPEETKSSKKQIGPKKKRVKHSNKQVEEDSKRIIEDIDIQENNEDYEVKDNFDSVNFRSSQEVEYIDDIEDMELNEEKVEPNTKQKFENLVWSEDKFPKK
ncbi:hypothetical protein [Romboutsia lituseburensis]|uniref:hypothetical protein n=1 Tax=Romboutsia lituseburensis TaxID=1537 RepID=UPI00215B6EC7|nr:hypothetical protein [Romboutsia lituseburensis]MCR8744466.1 hypothetical protein [Romboutsia lituseburensis]